MEDLKVAGNAAFMRGDWAAAETAYSEALAISPTAVVFANRAAARIKQSQCMLSLEDCDRAIELDPRYVKAHYRKGQVDAVRCCLMMIDDD
jgi:hypothetical protein